MDVNRVPNAIPIYIERDMEDIEFCIIKKNTALIISEVLQCSRQNIDSIMRRGNANKIRELDYVALQYVDKMYGENK